jgi:hypothetical protein
MDTFQDVISRWGTVAKFAIAVGVNERTAMSWWQRKSIPAEWLAPTVRAAMAAGHPEISAECLLVIAEERRLLRKAAKRRKLAA